MNLIRQVFEIFAVLDFFYNFYQNITNVRICSFFHEFVKRKIRICQFFVKLLKEN